MRTTSSCTTLAARDAFPTKPVSTWYGVGSSKGRSSVTWAIVGNTTSAATIATGILNLRILHSSSVAPRVSWYGRGYRDCDGNISRGLRTLRDRPLSIKIPSVQFLWRAGRPRPVLP